MQKTRSTSITELRVEYLHNPVGIDIKKPRFSWRIESTRPGIMQSHYRIIVTSDKDNPAIIWDSGKVESGLSVHIPYNGPQLQPFTRYHWTVTVWDNHGNQITTANRTDSYFETGLLNTGWSGAQWIKLAGNNLRKDAVLLFRSEFNIKKEIENGSHIFDSIRNIRPVYQ